MTRELINLRVWGDWACFTRPEMKVERVSYPLMTPSAARGILEAVFWEPQMYYVIDSIRVVRRGRWVSFRRNEVTTRISLSNARRWMSRPEEFQPILAGGGAPDGTQRNMLALEGVEYVISAEVRLSELGIKTGQSERKYRDEAERRARSGKCFHRPYLGVREFAADFDYEEDAEAAIRRRASELGGAWREWKEDDLGLMLYDLFDHDERAAGFRWLSNQEMAHSAPAKSSAKGKKKAPAPSPSEGQLVAPRAAFFRARVKYSTMDCYPSRIGILTQKGDRA